MMVHIVKISWDDSLPLTVEEINDDGGDADNGTNNTLEPSFGDAIPTYLESRATSQNAVIVETALLRNSESVAGLYAYSFSTISQSTVSHPNIRATRLAMACGLHSQRFTGDVYIGRLGYMTNQLTNLDLCMYDIQNACECSPDLRQETLVTFTDVSTDVSSPEWLEDAAQMNYHDGGFLAALANAMNRTEISDDDDDDDDSDEEDDVSSSGSDESNPKSSMSEQRVLTKIPLCLHCRGPASTLCSECEAVYFCDAPRKCKELAWSHQCLCSTWKLYVDHRDDLSSFPYFTGWQTPLLQKDCFTNENTYEAYLKKLGVIASQEDTPTKRNWWTTELHGWAGGASSSAKDVDIFHRVSFADGFALDNIGWIPKERQVTTDDRVKFDEHGLPILNSWQDWYQLRQISPASPVALLATFPLTLYYAIQHYGSVPLTVAKILERPLRVHVVGIEKELNFIDLFREVGQLLPEESIQIDMTWIVREDMLPQNSKDGKSLSLQLTSNMNLRIVAGTYGDSLDPDFDLNGSPDMIVGLNAGLYAYESWRHVVTYLNTHPTVIGVFTDYNEHSGLNCASLGGSKARKSLTMNPFRQPRAMPVYCMNLPQFSNGFIYIFNEQELE